MADSATTIQDLKDLAEKFRAERNWGRHHSPKNLAVSIAIEAAELMEKFQWDNYEDKNAKKEIRDELADILVYCLYLAQGNDIDISEAVAAKLEKAAKKYPVEIFNANQNSAEDYWRIKKEYRGKS